MRFSPSGSKILLVSGEVKIVAKFAGDHTPARGVEACVQFFLLTIVLLPKPINILGQGQQLHDGNHDGNEPRPLEWTDDK